jgi:RNA polymerase sigma-70 factor (ECF subfamily)
MNHDRPAYREIDDEQLMEAYVAGDHRAFGELFRRYARPLVCMLCERGTQVEDARELVQQGFLQLHRARHRFQAGRKLRPWLLTIVFNLRRDDVRRARRWRETPLAGDVVAESPPDPIDRRRRAQRVHHALGALSAKQRALIEMHWFEELTYPQIAERVGASPGAVKLRAFRAHAALRAKLQKAA